MPQREWQQPQARSRTAARAWSNVAREGPWSPELLSLIAWKRSHALVRKRPNQPQPYQSEGCIGCGFSRLRTSRPASEMNKADIPIEPVRKVFVAVAK